MSIEEEYTVIGWEDKDDIQRIITTLEIDATSALNVALQYKYVLEFFDGNLDFVNKSPCFWSEVITSLKYSMLMQAARLFDESKDAIGMKKVLNALEQSKYRDIKKKTLVKVRNEYETYQNLIDSVRTMRDKFYAHNDKTIYKNWDYDTDAILDAPLWERMIELLGWAKNSMLALRSTYGDNFPLWIETKNDVGNILPHNHEK